MAGQAGKTMAANQINHGEYSKASRQAKWGKTQPVNLYILSFISIFAHLVKYWTLKIKLQIKKNIKILGQVSRMTGILEDERSLDSCTLAVHSPLAYFISAIVKTFCKCAKSIIKVHVPEHWIGYSVWPYNTFWDDWFHCKWITGDKMKYLG